VARDLALTLRDADVVIIDEAHHFRNPGIKGEGIRSRRATASSSATFMPVTGPGNCSC